ncbi:alpha/beta fold hydrolase [Tropicibacter naphthalenivorans]|uniref:Acetoin dehydrogenase E2 subunit dihydrolipoyllysine-residue acetyltransferase n=1 Tax=Tropicibacter naphthalenivorans TaxID=441103 RepID=A0A0P1G0K7_9RHOB|nr:alpha/beta fold hydrolase [Tropicibacter naphthalenivorans]CUH75166.1 acetoin dehydrogenase E2 subunit dihydrolipoyllysine-residue acetyltransferase [Tropicibacter naphthalenivorans]SMC45790.1 Lysophospholipase, alpha-beta hydrolase superfamily [Tropicibacter naphthalenivorans]
MARILLVHGAAHGAWCWRDTIPALAALGHEVRAIDLPSHGQDQTPVEDVTLDLYAQAILDALDAPTVLVGHSMGGYPITRAAEIDNSNITHLAYLCAYTPWPDLTLSQMRHQAPSQPLLPAIRRDGPVFTFDPDMAPDLFYHDCTPEQVAFALANVCPQAVAPSETTVALTAASQDLPRGYIVCAQDGAIPPNFQRTMAERFDPDHVYELQTSHSPFFSAPQELAQIIDRISKT